MALTLVATPLAAALGVTDTAGNSVTLEGPAQRIVSLSPHTTEVLFAAGAGGRLVGAVSYSDYPEAARELPRVGRNDAVDFERIIALEPDLVVAWPSGNGMATVEKLRELGLVVYASAPRQLDDIARDIRRLGRLAGTTAVAKAAAEDYRARLGRLRRRYADAATVPVYFQIWRKPLMTINGEHIISRVLELCGGRNVFAELPALVPTVSVEAVLAARPDVILRAAAPQRRDDWRARWRQWRDMPAVLHRNLFSLDPDLITRPGPRLAEGAARVCRKLAKVRHQRAADAPAAAHSARSD